MFKLLISGVVPKSNAEVLNDVQQAFILFLNFVELLAKQVEVGGSSSITMCIVITYHSVLNYAAFCYVLFF